MESQMARPHGHSHEQESHIVGHQMEGEDEHHHEKKSVLNKVRAKARKIKDTLKKHDHGHSHDHDLDEEDDDEEEMVEHTEIHGAPIYDAAAIKSIGQVENTGQSGVNTGRSTAMDVDPLSQNVKPEGYAHEHVETKGQARVNLGRTTVLGEVPSAPENTPVSSIPSETHHSRKDDPTRIFVPGQEEHPGQPKVNLQRPKGLQEDPAAPKSTTDAAYTSSNYQSKVTDPTGKAGEEAGIGSVLRSFDKMNIYGESKPKAKSGHEQNCPTGTEDFLTSLPTGSHDQLSPELTPPKPVSTEEAFDSTKSQDHPRGNTADRQPNQSSYLEKISSATSVIADKAITAKNVVASKLGYGEEDDRRGHQMREGERSLTPESTVDYGKKIAATVTEKLTPVYEKVAEAGSTVLSKMPGTNTGTGNEKEHGVGGQDSGVSMNGYFAEKLKPGDEDRALIEVISEALYKKKTEQENNSTSFRPVTEVISDAWHKRKEEPDEATNRAMGKVIESEEVRKRLGATDLDSSKERIGTNFENNSGKGVVDKIKDAVGSWFAKGGETRGSQQPLSSKIGSAFEEEEKNSSTTGERRLQESGN